MSNAFREKILRDPVYGNVTIPNKLIISLIDTPEFQRLRRIRQLGMCFSVFHGAEHSRFQHAIGVMSLMDRIVSQWRENKFMRISREELMACQAAALIHDIGHGPFSHALENIFTGLDHEKIGRMIAEMKLAPLFEKYSIDPHMVTAIMEGTYNVPVFHELLSSQLDVDRMDYLLRDSLYTGAKYGLFDIDRIIASLRPLEDPQSGQIVCAVSSKGSEAVEGYLFSRYFMHWQVYLHKTVRASEVLLRVILKRARWLFENHPDSLELPSNLRFLFATCSDLDASDCVSSTQTERFLDGYLALDDFDFFHSIKLWRNSNDAILADLAQSFLSRQPFKAFDHPGAGPIYDRIVRTIKKRYGDDWRWYFHEDTPHNLGYDLYEAGRSKSPIRVVGSVQGSWQEISQHCRTKAIVALAEPISRPLLLVPRQCYQHIAKWLDSDRPYQSSLPF